MRRAMAWACFGAVWLVAGAASAQPEQVFTDGCYPACREGYVCNPQTGQCVSACNPPCAAGQTCTSSGQCVGEQPVGEQPTASPAQPVGTIGTPIVATGPAAVSPAPAPDQREHPPVGFLLRAGLTFGWVNGGTISLGASFRLARPVLLDVELRGAGGGGGDSSYALGAGEVSVRFAPPQRIGWMVRAGFGAGFLAEYETYSGEGYDYAYRVGYARFGGGVLFKGLGRTAYGIEGNLGLGAASQSENYVDFEDYGGFYLDFQILGVFNF